MERTLSGRERDDKVQRIKDAALTVFSQDGYGQATIQDVATEACVGKGTIYLYFSSKEELLDTILLDVLEGYRTQIEQIVAEDGDVRQRLRHLLTYVLGGADRRRRQLSFLLRGTSDIGGDFKRQALRIKKDIMEALTGLVRAGIERGEIRAADPLMMAHIISGTVESLAAARLWEYDELVAEADGDNWPEELAGLAVNCLYQGMKP